MNRKPLILVLLALLLIISACSGKKPPEQAAVRSKNVLTVLREMGRFYEKKDLDAFLSDVSNAYRDREAFKKSTSTVFSKYETIRFNIQYSRMIILIEEKGATRATFTWDAEWTAAGGSTVKDGGRTTLVMEPTTFKLLSIDGKNPFLAQPGEAPGAKP